MEASEGTVSDKKETEKISQRKTNSCIIKKSDHPPKFKEDTSKGSEITIKEFLDFLKTAYQVQDNIEGILRSEGLTDIVDWLELKENSLVKPNEIAVQTSDPKVKQDDKKGKCSNFNVFHSYFLVVLQIISCLLKVHDLCKAFEVCYFLN